MLKNEPFEHDKQNDPVLSHYEQSELVLVEGADFMHVDYTESS